MKRTVVITALMIAASFSALAQQPEEYKQRDKIVRQLGQFESDWLKANLNQDKAWLGKFFAGKLFVIPFEEKAVKSRAREATEMIDPQLKANEMKVRITGNITLLTNGGNRTYYFLDTFNRRDGKWQVIATHFSRSSAPSDEDIEQTILGMEREFSGAAVKKDTAVLQRIIADDFTGVKSSGAVTNKNQTINDIVSGDNVRLDTPEEMKVRVYGDMAVVTGRALIKTKNKEADNFTDNNVKLFFTNVWANRNGAWKLVSYQKTQIK